MMRAAVELFGVLDLVGQITAHLGWGCVFLCWREQSQSCAGEISHSPVLVQQHSLMKCLLNQRDPPLKSY